MATQTFNCPNCGAPIEYDGSDTPAIKCPFCENSVVIPPELRPQKPPQIQTINISLPEASTYKTAGRVSGAVLALIIGCTVLFVGAMIALPIYLTQRATSLAENALKDNPLVAQVTSIVHQLTEVPTVTPSPSPTPAFAQADLSFGQKGIGPGMLNDARYIAADGNGMVYVADYQDGRVQVFDSTGKYVTQWKVGDEKTIIYGMAANHKGEVFISYDNLLVGMDGASGKQLIKVTAPGGGEYGNLFVAPDGSLAATWYEARWGIITSLQGHRDDLIIFNPEGKAALTIPSFISGQTDDVALDTQVAIDGLGNIYGLERGSIFKFSPKGKYMDRFGSSGSQPGQFSSPRAIAIDGQGQVYVADSDKILLFSSEGQYLTDFPTDGVVDAMVIDEKGAIWGILRDKVTRFVLTGK